MSAEPSTITRNCSLRKNATNSWTTLVYFIFDERLQYMYFLTKLYIGDPLKNGSDNLDGKSSSYLRGSCPKCLDNH